MSLPSYISPFPLTLRVFALLLRQRFALLLLPAVLRHARFAQQLAGVRNAARIVPKADLTAFDGPDAVMRGILHLRTEREAGVSQLVAVILLRLLFQQRRPPAGAMAFAPFWIPETCARFSVDPKLWINEPTAHVPSLSNPIKIICYGIVRPFWGCKYPPIRKFPLLYFCIVRYATPFHFDKEFHRFVFENHDFLHHAF